MMRVKDIRITLISENILMIKNNISILALILIKDENKLQRIKRIESERNFKI